MAAGAVLYQTGETDMYNMGGLWRKMPITAVFTFVAVLGITGMPGFNGYASKTILHHAIDEAFLYGHPSFEYAEWIFTVVSAGTVCSFIKFYYFIFLRREPDTFKNNAKDKSNMIWVMGILAGLVALIGMVPNWIPDNVLIPAAMSLSYDHSFIGYYLSDMNFWNSKDLWGTVIVYALGGIMFIAGYRFHLFHLKLPRWMNAEKYFYTPITTVCEKFPDFCVANYEKPIIFGDTLIYAIILSIIMGALIITRFIL